MKKRLLVSFAIVFLFFSFATCIYFLYNFWYLNLVNDIKLSLNGDETISLNLGDEYIESGYSASFKDIDLTNEVKTYTNLDITKVGTYEITYVVNYNDKEASLRRNIMVVDNVSPEIKLKGKENVTLYLNSTYKDSGATASDNYDGNLTKSIETTGKVNTKEEGEYIITYTVKDNAGNVAKKERIVKVIKRPLVHKPGVAVLNYHFFGSSANNCPGINCITAAKFEDHLKYLKENNYKVLTMQEFVDYMYGNLNIPDKSVLITIDDGALGTGKHNGNILIPLLEKYEIPATLFLITGWWDKSNYISPYLDIESHSHDLHFEGVCNGVARGAKTLCVSKEERIDDLTKSVNVTNSLNAFCYPFYVYNDSIIEDLKEVGFKLAFAGGDIKASRNSNKYKIPRFHIKSDITLDDFISIVY